MNPDSTCRSTRYSLVATPIAAPTHAMISETVPRVPCSTSRQNGVYVPAINTKIMEWSSRRMRTYASSDHEPRW